MSGRRERNKQDKWQRIEAAAWEVFRAKGFEQATTREIAERADIAAGTLFLYAANKRELLMRLFRDALARETAEAFAALSAGPTLLDEALAIFGHFFRFYAQAPELARLFVQELLVQPPAQREEQTQVTLNLFQALGERVRAAQARGEVAPDVAPEQAALNLFAAYYLVLTAWLSGQVEQGEALTRLRAALALQQRGLAPETQRSVTP